MNVPTNNIASRPTFEQAVKGVLSGSQLRLCALGDLGDLDWDKRLDEDCRTAHTVIDRLCEDLSAVTGERIKRRRALAVTIFEYRVSADAQAAQAWGSFQRLFSIYVNKVVEGLWFDSELLFNYRLDRLSWWDNAVTTTLPTTMELPKTIILRDAMRHETEDMECPRHIRRILEALDKTHYDLQPYVLKGKGGQLLVVRLGSQWPDIALSTWERPSWSLSGILAACMLFSALSGATSLCFLLSSNSISSQATSGAFLTLSIATCILLCTVAAVRRKFKLLEV